MYVSITFLVQDTPTSLPRRRTMYVDRLHNLRDDPNAAADLPAAAAASIGRVFRAHADVKFSYQPPQ